MTGALTRPLARTALPVALGLVLLMQGSAQAAISNVRIRDFLYRPDSILISTGDTVRWLNVGPTDHTATQNAPLVWFDSGLLHAGDQFQFTFIAAGGYLFHCTLHFNMTGLVAVVPTALPPSGAQGTVFTITVASQPAPSGFVYDIQRKDPGVPGFTDWQIGITTPSATFDSTGQPTGNYSFRSRLRRLSDNISSLYSQPATITVTP